MVDVVTPVAPGGEVRTPVTDSLTRQGHVDLRCHVVEGPEPIAGEHRSSTIARARNRMRRVGSAPYVMFLDSDVVLPPHGIEQLVFGLFFNLGYGALGLNYQKPVVGPSQHVAMGAILFLRPVLERIHFRTEPGKCECWCCCADLRRMGYHVDYLPGLRAMHLHETFAPDVFLGRA